MNSATDSSSTVSTVTEQGNLWFAVYDAAATRISAIARGTITDAIELDFVNASAAYVAAGHSEAELRAVYEKAKADLAFNASRVSTVDNAPAKADLAFNASRVSTVDNSPAIVATLPTVTANGNVLSKKEALALPANKGIARRIVEAAILSAHKANATLTAEGGALELGRAARLGHKVVRSVNKSGGIAYRISAKAMAEKKETASAKVARLEAELALLVAERGAARLASEVALWESIPHEFRAYFTRDLANALALSRDDASRANDYRLMRVNAEAMIRNEARHASAS